MRKYKLLGIMGTLITTLLIGSVMAVPAFAKEARPHEKVPVCHYQDMDEFGPGPDGILGDDPATPLVDESLDDVLLSTEGWGEISPNRHSVAKHVANHFDLDEGRGDFEIDDAIAGDTQADCDALVLANPSALP